MEEERSFIDNLIISGANHLTAICHDERTGLSSHLKPNGLMRDAFHLSCKNFTARGLPKLEPTRSLIHP